MSSCNISQRFPTIQKAKRIFGRTLIFRDVCESDADFILHLRTSQKSQYLSETEDDIEKQIVWLKNYAIQSHQAYFIIENLDGIPQGVVRLYDAQGESFCWGSWILKDGAPQSAAIESALMVYSYAIDYLGFSSTHCDVRKGNESVWRFHERFGAQRVGETPLDYLYEISLAEIKKSQIKYRKYLPEVLKVEAINYDN